MYTLYKFHFLNGISEINQLFDDILIIWPAPVMSDKAAFVSRALFCVQRYRGNLDLSHYNSASCWQRINLHMRPQIV